jgi:hypothetical protein
MPQTVNPVCEQFALVFAQVELMLSYSVEYELEVMLMFINCLAIDEQVV